MFCTNCGKEIPDNSHICMFCGKSLEAAPVEEVKVETLVSETVVNTVSDSNISETSVSDTVNDVVNDVVAEVKEEVKEVAEVKEEIKEEAKEIAEVKEEVKEEIKEVQQAVPVQQAAPINVAPVVSQPVPQPIPQANPNPAAPPVAPKKEKKKGGAGIVIFIIILVLLLAGCGAAAYFLLLSPSAKIKTAVKNNDIKTVCELYPQLTNEKDKTFVQDSMFNYACSLEDQFKDESIDFATAKADLDEIGKKILKGDEEFEELVDDMEALSDSRDAYAAAEKAFKKEDYQTAYDKYALVIKDDSNYKNAQKKMEECLENMTPAISGTWSCELDFGDYLLEEMGADGMGYNIYFPVEFIIDLEDDGTGWLGFEEDSFMDGLELAKSDIIDIMYDMLEQETGMSRTEIDDFLYDFGYGSLYDMLDEELDFDGMYDDSELSQSFTYYVEDDVIYLDSGNGTSELAYYMSGDFMVVTEIDGSELTLSEFGVSLPLYFEQ